MMEVELGDLVKCKVTGFTGIVTSYAKSLTGCDRVIVQPPVDKDGKHTESAWMDIYAVTILEKNKVPPETMRGQKPGGPPTRGKP